MKIAILGDSHFGCRKNSEYFKEVQKKFFDKFFDYLEEHNIDTVIHTGDYFDNRKSVNFETLFHAKECFINPLQDMGITLHMLVGNHDSYYKSNGDIASTKLLYSKEFNTHIYDKWTNLEFDGVNFLMVPWIFPDQEEEMVDMIKLSTADVCVGHFEMMGIVFQADILSRKGIDSSIFTHFPHVFSGHYHKQSEYYVGSPYQMTWTDYNDPKKIVVYDTKTKTAEDVYLSDEVYIKLEYDGQDDIDLSTCKGNIVRVIVKSKNDPIHFDNFITKLELADPHDIDIKEEYLYVDVINLDEMDNETDTLSILMNSVEAMEEFEEVEKKTIKEIIKKLYEKAIT